MRTFPPVLIDTPHWDDLITPSVLRWVATESPINFRLSRQDYIVTGHVDDGTGHLKITIIPSITAVLPVLNDDIAVYDEVTNSMYIGTLTDVSAYPILITDIHYVAGMNILYMNDNSLHAGYYFEGQLTINGILEPITVIASPDSFGIADLDVSGLLRIKTSLGKIGDYSALIMKETTKSGNFSFEYRGRWYVGNIADIDDYTPESGIISPPSPILWYYGECVRSEEQGTNLHEFVATPNFDAPFLNSFERPVYFLGLPFDISFIFPESAPVSPPYLIIVTQKYYNSANTQLGADIVSTIDVDSLEGFINSLNINAVTVPDGAAYFTIQITI
jgi:hypothetical protein